MEFFAAQLPSPIFIDSCESTNSFIQKNPQQFQKNFSAVTCKEQTAGRGRHNRSWQMETGKDLAFSFVYFPTDLTHISAYTLTAGLAVARALDSYTNKHSLKWPNDILVDDAKLAGILIEYTSLEKKPVLIVGVGLNVNSHKKTLEQKNISLLELANDGKQTAKEIDLSSLLTSLLYSLKIHFEEHRFPLEKNFTTAWLERCSCLQKKVCINNALGKRQDRQRIENFEEKLCATIIGLDDYGHLLLQTDNEIIALEEGTLRFS